MAKKKVFITGISGFIGFHLAMKLHQSGYSVSGCDSFIPYYELNLKEERAKRLLDQGILIHRMDICNEELLQKTIEDEHCDLIIHLAAQAGVRYCLTNPSSYFENNLKATFNILEISKRLGSLPIIFASSSSVYGNTTLAPFREDAAAAHPESFYGATKRCCELMAETYSKSWDIPITALRFFTVYGSWGRPDMAYYKFSSMIINETPIPIFGKGLLKRDFTYIDDTVSGIVRAIENQKKGFKVYNLGKGHPETVMQLVEQLEIAFGKKAILEWIDGPIGDVEKTIADTSLAENELGFRASIPLEKGIPLFVEWFNAYERTSKSCC